MVGAETNEVVQRVRLFVILDPELAERADVVDVDFVACATNLASVIVAVTGTLALLVPRRAVVSCVTTYPPWMVFASAIFTYPRTKAVTIAE